MEKVSSLLATHPPNTTTTRVVCQEVDHKTSRTSSLERDVCKRHMKSPHTGNFSTDLIGGYKIVYWLPIRPLQEIVQAVIDSTHTFQGQEGDNKMMSRQKEQSSYLKCI